MRSVEVPYGEGPAAEPVSAIDRAIALAIETHRGQTDLAGLPYILHPLRVMFTMVEELDRVVAVLHDVVEDASNRRSADAAVRSFGGEVYQAVDALTRRDDESYEDYIERCAHNETAARVKIADLLDNLDPTRIPNPGPKDRARAERYMSALRQLHAQAPAALLYMQGLAPGMSAFASAIITATDLMPLRTEA